jgi:multidrug resistance efflux pump
MSASNSSAKPKRKILRWFALIIIIIIMLLPYPYETGGSFSFRPLDRVELHTQVSGEVKEVFVKEGDRIKKDQAIGLLDPREHQKNYDVVLADLDKARADLKLLEAGAKPEEIEKAKQQVTTAEKRYEYSSIEAKRLEELYKTGVTPEEEYLEAAKIADVDAANLEFAKAHLKLVKSGARPEEVEAQKAIIRDLETRLKFYEEDIAFSRITAPISGVIITAYMESKVGQILNKGDLFAIMQDATKIQAEIYVPEGDIGEVSLDASVRVKLWAYPTKYFHGKVVSIAPAAEVTNEGNVVRVLSEFENPDGILKPEMTGEAKIKGETRPVFLSFTRMLVRFFLVEVWSWFP